MPRARIHCEAEETTVVRAALLRHLPTVRDPTAIAKITFPGRSRPPVELTRATRCNTQDPYHRAGRQLCAARGVSGRRDQYANALDFHDIPLLCRVRQESP